MSLTSLGDALKQKMKQDKPLQMQAEVGLLLSLSTSVLQDFLGPENSKYIKPLFIKNRTLTITCANSVVSQEIHLNQAKIVADINAKYGQNALDRIRYLL